MKKIFLFVSALFLSATTLFATAPESMPTAPTVPANQVKAVYSAVYSADCNFADWGSGTTYAQEDYGKKFTTTSLGYFGLVDFALNCSKMEALHLDVWFTEAGSFRVVPIHGGAEQGVTVTVAEGEVNTWKSVDLALNEGAFASVTDWSNVYQIKIDNVPSQTFWLNNIYFYTSQAPAPVEGEQFVDETSGLKFEVTAVGDTNTVMVIENGIIIPYSGTSYTVPATVSYQSVTFNVTEIGKDAFEDCSSLESVTIPASVTTIGEYAFRYCESLQSVTLSEGLLTIGEGAFDGCESLQSITLPAGLLTIGMQAFDGCESLQSVTIPASVTTIGAYAFNGCESLQSVTLSENLTTIEEAAFYSSGLTSITIPAGVISLGMGAFAECAGLTSVTFLGNACQNNIGEMAFSGVGADAPALLTLHGTWAKENQPDEDGNWYGGKFELSEDPTALPTLFDANVDATKFLDNGQVIIRKNNKTYNTLGQEVR